MGLRVVSLFLVFGYQVSLTLSQGPPRLHITCDKTGGCIRGNCQRNFDGSFYCDCQPGHEVSFHNLTVCVDRNECNYMGTCENGICFNTQGSYFCECNSGFTRTPDRTSCLDNGLALQDPYGMFGGEYGYYDPLGPPPPQPTYINHQPGTGNPVNGGQTGGQHGGQNPNQAEYEPPEVPPPTSPKPPSGPRNQLNNEWASNRADPVPDIIMANPFPFGYSRDFWGPYNMYPYYSPFPLPNYTPMGPGMGPGYPAEIFGPLISPPSADRPIEAGKKTLPVLNPASQTTTAPTLPPLQTTTARTLTQQQNNAQSVGVHPHSWNSLSNAGSGGPKELLSPAAKVPVSPTAENTASQPKGQSSTRSKASTPGSEQSTQMPTTERQNERTTHPPPTTPVPTVQQTSQPQRPEQTTQRTDAVSKVSGSSVQYKKPQQYVHNPAPYSPFVHYSNQYQGHNYRSPNYQYYNQNQNFNSVNSNSGYVQNWWDPFDSFFNDPNNMFFLFNMFLN